MEGYRIASGGLEVHSYLRYFRMYEKSRNCATVSGHNMEAKSREIVAV